MRALIIEDEMPSARRLERMLSNFEIEILSVLTSVKQTIKWFQKNQQPDVIFLDIHLSDGLCFEIFKDVNINSKIIFTTAFHNYSIKAFEYNSISYLLKPIKSSDLEYSIEKAQRLITKDEDFEKLKSLFINYETENYKTTFTVKAGLKIKIIKEEEICCFYSFENTSYLKTKDLGYIFHHSLSFLENELNPKVFFRVNRAFIIHINAINKITSYPNGRLNLKLKSFNERDIIVSREKVKKFKNWIA